MGLDYQDAASRWWRGWPVPAKASLSYRMNLCGGGLDFGAVVETGVPVAAAFRGEVHKVPDGNKQIDAALFDVRGHPRMPGVEMLQRAVGVAGEYGNCRVLMPFAVFAAKVVLERAVAGAEQAQLVPAASTSVRPESGDVGGGHHGEVKILSQVVRHAVRAVDPGGAH